MSRFQDILDAVDAMFAAHDEWESDRTAPEQPTEKLEFAINSAIETCRYGDAPQSCRELLAAMEALGKEWAAYQNGQWDRQQRPLPAFWEAWRNVVTARSGATPIRPRRPESVSELLRQGVSYNQIAMAIYGHRGQGPFLEDGGAVRVDLIEQQARFEDGKPGAERVIPEDWIHPAEQERVREHNQQFVHRLQRLEARQEQTRGYVEPKSVDECLQEGMLPAQVANVKDVPIEQVWERVRALGLNLDGDPLGTPAFQTAPTAPSGQEGAAGESQQSEAGAGDGPVGISGQAVSDEEALQELIAQTAQANANLGASDIAAKVSEELGETVSTQKVVAVLRSRQKPATAGV